jgi:exodeoxyribonuclease-1
MSPSYYFYDLETTGFRATTDRIMQFAGQRVDTDFKPLGKPDNILVKLPDDILPTPSAILFTGLSLKENKVKGISEPEFAKYFNEKIATTGTIFIGFNNLRFDDEFIRYLNYRNFYDAYSWHWAMNRSRWDLMDAVRMTRALRPEGINWPIDKDGKVTNKLEKLTEANNLLHTKAHDAMSDVEATIEVAKLMADKQPKMFNYLLKLRDKKLSTELINSNKPFIYTTGKYSSHWFHTSVVLTVDINIKSSTAQVYDLRIDPEPLLNMSVADLVEKWRYDPEKDNEEMPIKTIKLNRCPAVAPLSVLDEATIKRLSIDVGEIKKHEQVLKDNKKEFNNKLQEVVKALNAERDSRQKTYKSYADQKLYSGFVSSEDQKLFPGVHQNPPELDLHFKDERLNDLFFIYLGRNYRDDLNPDQLSKWRELVHERLFEGEGSLIQRYKEEIAEQKKTSKNTKLISELEELAKSIENDYGMPEPAKDVSQSLI